MSHVLKLNVDFELIWGGPLEPEVEPSFANIFSFRYKLKYYVNIIYYFKQQNNDCFLQNTFSNIILSTAGGYTNYKSTTVIFIQFSQPFTF